jgi:hypothetical protein
MWTAFLSKFLLLSVDFYCTRRIDKHPDQIIHIITPIFIHTRKDLARPALFQIICYLCYSMYCLCVNVYCTTATGCTPNCSWQIYHIILPCVCWRSRCPHADQILPKLPACSYLSYVVAFTGMTCRNIPRIHIRWQHLGGRSILGYTQTHTKLSSIRATYIRNNSDISDEHRTNKSLNS